MLLNLSKKKLKWHRKIQNKKDVNISHSAGNPMPYEAILSYKQKQMATPPPAPRKALHNGVALH